MMQIKTMLASGVAIASAGVLAAAAGTAAAAPSAGRAGAPAGGPVPVGFQPASATFVSASRGWVLGTAPCAHAPCTSVLRTSNGGRSWVGIPAPRFKLAKFNGSAGLIRLRFADSADGFAFGSQLWVTHSGGARWHRVRQVPGYIVDLEAAGGVVYAASQRFGHVAIYRSPVGTDSWRRVAGLPVVNGVSGLGAIALHGSAAWIVLGRHLYVSQTGTGWVRGHVTCPPMWAISSVAAADSRHVGLVCSGEPGAGNSMKEFFASTDGGLHFTKIGNPPFGGDGGLLAEPTSRHLFIATASGATWLYVSNAGGTRWHLGLFLNDGGKGWSDFGFTTATQGLAVEGTPVVGSHLYMTWNAGKTWHKVRF